MADVNAILEQIKGLTLLEAAQLVKGIEEAFGVSAAAAAVAAAPRRARRQRRLRQRKRRPSSPWF